MDFRIADTFTESLARLTGEEQKTVKTTAFDLQIDPVNPGMSFHKLTKARDKNFWSVRVGSDIRLIVHKTPGSLLLCYVGHHDKAYDWAERRKLETHPKTGAAQLVEIRETVQHVLVPTYAVAEPRQATARARLFDSVSDDELLAFGVPGEWLGDVRKATEESVLDVVGHLPGEAAEALLVLAVGGTPRAPVVAPSEVGPFEHPDAQRRFRVMGNVEELHRALEFPWDRWTVFLHPEQRQIVERKYTGPARVSGSAGTGKTIVALHRAVFLARSNPEARVLLTTFSDALAHALSTQLRRLVSNEPRLAERIDVHAIDSIGARLYKANVGALNIAPQSMVDELQKDALAKVAPGRFRIAFLRSEWEQVVDAWQLDSWDAYREVVRLGRKTRLPEAQRALLWTVFEKVRADLAARNLVTKAGMFSNLATALSKSKRPAFEFAVVDEAQDLSVPHLRFLAAVGASRPDALFFAGDLGQRIFQQPFSWRSLGVDVRGRSRTLRVNYRTSHQIRMQADRLLGPEVSDADGNVETRTGTVSVFNGLPPQVRICPDRKAEVEVVANWLSARTKGGVAPHEIGVFVRTGEELERARAAVEKAVLVCKVLDERVETATGLVSVGTMHFAKGLEFRAVVVMACDDEVIPLQSRIESVGDESDLREVYETERHLLYVACTRARDYLLVTGVEPASEFLEDLGLGAGKEDG